MQTTVTTLLREFPKIRRAAMRGERIVIKTRQGNLVLTAEKAKGDKVMGSMKGRRMVDHGIDPSAHTIPLSEWFPKALKYLLDTHAAVLVAV